MKQKYTLNIADLQISVISDAPAEEVEKVGMILDRKMREIYLKSRCPKTEAALLCALECVADRISLTEKTAELEDKCAKYGVVLDGLKDRNAELPAELERVRNIKREDMEYTNENGYSIRVVPHPSSAVACELFDWIYRSDVEDKKTVIVFPNSWKNIYSLAYGLIILIIGVFCYIR